MRSRKSTSKIALVDLRDRPRYTVTEVAAYLGLSASTVRGWFFGRLYRAGGAQRRSVPVAAAADRNPRGPSLSFFNLAEAHVLSATRRDYKIPMSAVRRAAEYVAQATDSMHPLVTQQFSTDGKDLFIRIIEEEGEIVVNASRKGQKGFPEILDEYLRRIDWDVYGLPLRIYPVSESPAAGKSIVLSADLGSGRPVLSGTGVLVETIWNRYEAGESVDELASDYEVTPVEIKRAIAYRSHARAA